MLQDWNFDRKLSRDTVINDTLLTQSVMKRYLRTMTKSPKSRNEDKPMHQDNTFLYILFQLLKSIENINIARK